MDKSSSFTLIELMTVVAIVAILSGITLVGFNLFLKQGKIAKSMAFDSSIHFNLGYAIKGDWKMNDNAANSTVVDTSGYNNDGTFYNGGNNYTSENSVDGANGTALEFDGVDDNIETSFTPNDLDTSDLTVSFWMYRNNDSLEFQLSSNTNFYFYGNVSFMSIRIGDTYENWDDVTFNQNEWYLITATRDYDAATVKYYVNGEYQNEETHASYKNTLGVGNLFIGSKYDSSEFFNGSIDQVRIYSEAFSLSQVKYQYYTGLQRLYDKGLMSGKEYKSRIVKLTSES